MTAPRFTPVPLELFEDEQMDTIFYHNFPKAKGNNEIVLCNVLGRSNVVILFAMDKHTHLLLTEHFPTARFFSTASPLTEYFDPEKPVGNSGNYIHTYASNKWKIFCFDKGNLLRSTHFHANKPQTVCITYYMYGNN